MSLIKASAKMFWIIAFAALVAIVTTLAVTLRSSPSERPRSPIMVSSGMMRPSVHVADADGVSLEPERKIRSIALFAVYPRKQFLDYHTSTLRELARAGYDTVLINSKRSVPLPHALNEYVVKVVYRDNGGYDWCAWSDVIREMGGFISQYDRVLLTNDSYVLRTDVDVSKIVHKMRAMDLDVWAMSSSYEVQRHYQSFWMDLRTNILLESRTFDVALDPERLLAMKSIEEVIAQREVPLLETLLKEYPDLTHKEAFWTTDAPINPYVTRAKEMWRRGFPLVKMSAIVRVKDFEARSAWRTQLNEETVRLVDEWLTDYN